MDYYRNKLSASDLNNSRSHLLSPKSTFSNFEKLLQYLKEKYNERIEAIQNAQNEFKKECALDAALSVMKQSPITEKFLDIRINEIFNSTLLQENEQTISKLQSELTQKEAELLKLSSSTPQARPLTSSHFNTELKGNRLEYQELLERERFNSEKLKEENSVLKRELSKTREICMENEKLIKYCEQLENEREKVSGSGGKDFGTMIEAQKQAGIETIRELQMKFKKKSRLLKKKIVEQKGTIEGLVQEVGELKRKKNRNEEEEEKEKEKGFGSKGGNSERGKQAFERREAELIEKHKQQIMNLQNQYQGLLENKVREIEEQINPRLRGISQEQHLELARTNKELENQVNALRAQNSALQEQRAKNEKLETKNLEMENSLLSLKTQLELSEYKKKPAEIEKWQQEALLHEETKIKLKKSESRTIELNTLNKSLEEKLKTLSSSLKSYQNSSTMLQNSAYSSSFKLKKLQNQVFLMKSQLKSLKNTVFEDFTSLKSDTLRKFSDLLKSTRSKPPQSLFQTQETQKLTTLLRTNSEAFDRLQEEVKSEYSKIKLKSQEKLAETLREFRSKHDKEIENLKNENRRIQDLLDRANSTMFMDSHLNKQLKDEIESLRTEKEAIRKKQQVLEEKIQTQTNNFKIQLKHKQQELENLKNSTAFN